MTPPNQASEPTSGGDSLLFRVDPTTHSATITDLLVLDDGSSMVTVGMDKRVRLWDLNEIDLGEEPTPKTMLGHIGPGSDGSVLAAAVHPVDGIVVTANHSAFTGGSVLRFRVPWSDSWQRTFRWSGTIADLAVTSDGMQLVVATTGGETAGSTGPGQTPRLEVFRFDDLVPIDEVDQSDRASREAELMEPPQPQHRVPLVIGPARVAVGPSADGVSTVVVTPTFVGRPQLFRLSPEGLVERGTDLTGGSDGPPAVGLRASVAISADHIAIAGENTGLTLLDTDGRVVVANVADAGGGAPSGVAFSPDGFRLVVGSRAGAQSEITVHDVYQDGEVVGRRRYDDHAIAVGFRGDDRVVSAGGSRFSLHTWYLWSTEPEADDRFVDGAGQVIDAVGISGNQIGFGNPDPVRPNEPRGEVANLARRFDLDLLSLVPAAEEAEQAVPLGGFQRAIHAQPDGVILQLDQGQVFLEPAGVELADGVGFSSDQATAYGFAGDREVIVGRRSGALAMFLVPPEAWGPGADVHRVVPDRRLVSHLSAVLDLAVGERWVVTGGRDQVLRLWSRDQLSAGQPGTDDPVAQSVGEAVEPELNLFITATNEWVIWSRSGYYASSHNGDRYISYHYNRGEGVPARAYRGDQFVRNLYRPDVIRSVLELGSEAAALDALAVTPFSVAASLPPEVRLVESAVTFGDEVNTADLIFEVIDAANPTTKIVVLENGIPAFEIDVADQPGEIVDADGPVRRYYETVFFGSDNYKLSIIAENAVARAVVEDQLRIPLVAVEDETAHPTSDLKGLVLPLPSAETISGVGDPYGEVVIEAAQSVEMIAEDLTRGRVVGAEVNITLQIDEGDEPLSIVATRNQDTVWEAEAGPGVGFDGHLILPLKRGYNEVEVIAERDGTRGVLFSGRLDLSPRYIVSDETDDHNDKEPHDDSGDVLADPDGQQLQPVTGVPESAGPFVVPIDEPDPNLDRLHLAAEGETLRMLAVRYYGHESRYPLIFEANPQLADLDRVPVGTELVIPALRTVSEADGSTDEVDLAGWQTVQEVTSRPQREPINGDADPISGRYGDPAGTDPTSSGPMDSVLSADPATGLPQSSGPAVDELAPDGSGGRKGTGGTPRDLPPDSDSATPNLYLLSIGVSNLASRAEGFANLSWPGDDAAAIADRFNACQGDQFGQVHQIGLGPRDVIEGADATKANIEQAVDDLAAAVKARAAQKRRDRVATTDVTVVFFSGHGMSRVAVEGEQEGLFLIPHDYDQDRWQDTSVSLLGIAETLCTLPQTELIIFIDACRSGFAGTDFAQRIKPEQFGKRVEAISPRTIYVLSSTARDLDSWEFGLKYPYNASAPDRRFVGHGLFTHAILKRMDEADQANRGLSVLELGAAVHRQFETWRSWKAFADIKVRQDPWYQFHRSVRHFEFYKKSK